MSRILAGLLISAVAVTFFTESTSAQQTPAAPAPALGTAPPPNESSVHAVDQYLPPLRTLTLAHDDERRQLPVPEGDFVAKVVTEPIPHWYVTPPWFGARRPVRTLYPFQHRPLYFEDSAAERCGISAGCLQPGVSFARFTSDLLLLPCRICEQHPNECIPAGGDCPVCWSPPKGSKPRHAGVSVPSQNLKSQPHVAAKAPPQTLKAAAPSGKAQLTPAIPGRMQPDPPKPKVLTGPVKAVSKPASADQSLSAPPGFAKHPGKR